MSKIILPIAIAVTTVSFLGAFALMMLPAFVPALATSAFVDPLFDTCLSLFAAGAGGIIMKAMSG